MTLGEKIARYRKLADLTQGELAAKLDVHAAHVSRWETDRVRPHLKTLTRIAEVLGVSLDELSRSSDNPPAEPPSRDQDTIRLVREIEQLDEEDRHTVRRVVEAMLTKQRVRRAIEAS